MKHFILYYTPDETLKQECTDKNYEELEQLYDCGVSGTDQLLSPLPDGISIELRRVYLMTDVKRKTAHMSEKREKAVDLFLHDMRDRTSSLFRDFYKDYRDTVLMDEVFKTLTKEEQNASFWRERETWIACCLKGIEDIAELKIVSYNFDGFVERTQNYFPFYLQDPESVLAKRFPDGRLKTLLDPNKAMMIRGDYYLTDFGGEIFFNYVMPYYYIRIVEAVDPESPLIRNVGKYCVGLH